MIPAPKANVLLQIGLALEAGCDREQMIETWGQFVIDWLDEAKQSEEFQRLLKEQREAFPLPPIVNGRYAIPADDVAERNRRYMEWLAEWE